MVGSDEGPVAVRDRVTILTSIVLLVIAAAAWVSVVQSSLRGDDMMMTMPMPATAAAGFAFVVSWCIMMTAMMLPSAVPLISLYGATVEKFSGDGDAFVVGDDPVEVGGHLFDQSSNCGFRAG